MIVARARTPHGVIPVLTVMLVHMGAFVWACATAPMPWATPRNVLEGQVAVVEVVRNERQMLFTSRPADKAFWTRVARYGIISRVGTLVDGDEPLSMWESRKTKWPS